MTPTSDILLTAFWTSIMAGFTYLWVTMLLSWLGHRDNRALVYVLLLLQLSSIAAINVIIRGNAFGMDAYVLVAIQRGLWFAAFLTSWAVVDIYQAQHRKRAPRVTRMAEQLEHWARPDDGQQHGGMQA